MKAIEDDPRPSHVKAGEPDPWGWEAREAERLRSNEQVEPLRLTEAERVALRRQAVRDLLRAIIIQVVVSVVVAALAYAVSGSTAGVSALVGAAAYAIPNALFAFRLILSAQKPGGANPATFFFGEFFKIAVAVVFIVAAAKFGREWLVWPAFLAGLVCALKSQWLVLAFGKNMD